jgi:CRISPR-associated endonuclease/helicase Cas3
MIPPQDFDDWFQHVTGYRPYPYQRQLALSTEQPIALDIPTGLGKTAATVLAWMWQQQSADFLPRPPLRLVYVLPMRTLVDQVYGEIRQWLENSGADIEVHQLMGGAVSKNWDNEPTKPCILVGTQDQILSRCLNRGYSMSKYRWPVQFGLLNQDCLFIIDETQLMGVGLRTTAQLQGLRQKWPTYNACRTIWMSATLDKTLLHTPDHQPDWNKIGAELTLGVADRQNSRVQKLLDAQKLLNKFSIACPAKAKDEAPYIQELAQQAKAAFEAHGGMVLIICNRVRRAQAVYDQLDVDVRTKRLVHSRFRPHERQDLNEQLLADPPFSGIVVATQAIEAGIDISAHHLFTELSPWSSFVQRVGRCNRRGLDNNIAKVFWIDLEELNEEATRPYEMQELIQTKELLSQLTQVGPKALGDFWETLKPEQRPQTPINGLIPRQHDLLQLFDTSSDLSGHDIDISCFIREAQNTDVAIAWREWPENAPPADFPALQRDELCQVGIGAAKAFLQKAPAYVFDRLTKEWRKINPKKPGEIYPGLTLLVSCQSGGYHEKLGFTGNAKDRPPEVSRLEIDQDTEDKDLLTYIDRYVSLEQHSNDIVTELQRILDADRAELPTAELLRAARWHDAGKAHPHFQEILHHDAPLDQTGVVLAKSKSKPKSEDGSDNSYSPPPDRRGFRHELVSALLALQQNESFLVAYLAACHHGKVRMTIQPRPTEQAPQDRKDQQVAGPIRYALGVQEGDAIPTIELGDGLVIAAANLSLACIELGGDRSITENADRTVMLESEASWTARAVSLLEQYGPFRLAYLEALIRIADWKASAKKDDEKSKESEELSDA